MKLWLEQFNSTWDISKKHLEDAVEADILKLSKKQMQEFNIKFEKVKSQKKDFSKDKMLKMLIDYLKPNSEYDILLLNKRLQILIHIEIKSSSTKGDVSCAETERYLNIFLENSPVKSSTHNFRNLRSRYESAKDQLRKGQQMFENVMKPIADTLENWRYTGFVAFPEIENRNELTQYLKLADEDITVRILVISFKLKSRFYSLCLLEVKSRMISVGGSMN